MGTDIIWGEQPSKGREVEACLEGVWGMLLPTVGKGEFGRLGPAAGEGAGALGHSTHAQCLEYWVQGGMTLETSE